MPTLQDECRPGFLRFLEYQRELLAAHHVQGTAYLPFARQCHCKMSLEGLARLEPAKCEPSGFPVILLVGV
jgi:hypothetical protein